MYDQQRKPTVFKSPRYFFLKLNNMYANKFLYCYLEMEKFLVKLNKKSYFHIYSKYLVWTMVLHFDYDSLVSLNFPNMALSKQARWNYWFQDFNLRNSTNQSRYKFDVSLRRVASNASTYPLSVKQLDSNSLSNTWKSDVGKNLFSNIQ